MATESIVAPYGAWKSPITSDLIVAGTIRLGQIHLDGEDVYWIEGRPAEKGRNVIVRRRADGSTDDITPPPDNARTRVHEYGGGAYLVADRQVYFSNFADQRLVRIGPDGEPVPLTAPVDRRYADGVLDPRRNRIVVVREEHTASGHEPTNAIVATPTNGGEDTVLVAGADFYAWPRLSPDGARLAWTSWSHPNMPWDGCELWVGDVAPDGTVGNQQRVAGGERESIYQPAWSPDSTLYFISDRTGWWNLYRWRDGQTEPLHPIEAEFGLPQWGFGVPTYALLAAEQIVCSFIRAGIGHLATLDTRSGERHDLTTPYTSISDVRADGRGRAVFVGASATEAAAIVRLHVASGRTEVLRRSSNVEVDPDYISEPRPIEFPTEGGKTAHALFYRPRNKDFTAPDGETPPLLVKSHGGPTGSTSGALSLSIQYWTSRGIAVLDVNYGGSTGYGREYRERLNGEWGIVDVDDCANGARYLVERGEVDGNRLAISGGSAGGYTTLCALTFRDTFRAGASYYGVSDLAALAEDTHKFESRYLDSMVGPYPARRDLYEARSPIHHVDRLNCPVIFFQGLEDKVVPPSQAELMVEAIRQKGLPVAYIPFEGEQHGFRQAQNIKRALDAELYFYSRIFGFELADPVEPVPIENLP